MFKVTFRNLSKEQVTELLRLTKDFGDQRIVDIVGNFTAEEAKLMGWWVPVEGEKVPDPKTKDEWLAYMRNRLTKKGD